MDRKTLREEILRLRSTTKLSVSAIAKELGVTKNTVSGLLYRLGATQKQEPRINPRPSPPRPARYPTPFTPPPRPIPAPTPIAEEPEPLLQGPPSLPIELLRHGECRDVALDPDVPGGLYCCAPVARGAYCARHAALYYEPPRDKRSRPNSHRNVRRAA